MLLLEKGIDIYYVQRMLEHSSIVTMQIHTYAAGNK